MLEFSFLVEAAIHLQSLLIRLLHGKYSPMNLPLFKETFFLLIQVLSNCVFGKQQTDNTFSFVVVVVMILINFVCFICNNQINNVSVNPAAADISIK